MVPTRKLDRVSPTSQETLVLRLLFRRERETRSGVESIVEKSVVSCPERIPLVLLGLKFKTGVGNKYTKLERRYALLINF